MYQVNGSLWTSTCCARATSHSGYAKNDREGGHDNFVARTGSERSNGHTKCGGPVPSVGPSGEAILKLPGERPFRDIQPVWMHSLRYRNSLPSSSGSLTGMLLGCH